MSEASSTISGAEIFASGNQRGKDYTDADLADIVLNFDRFSGPKAPKVLLNVPAVIGHEEDQTYLERTDLPAAGWADALGAKDGILYCDFTDVPPEVARLVLGKAYRKISAEIYDEPPPGVPGDTDAILAELGSRGKDARGMLAQATQEVPAEIQRQGQKRAEAIKSGTPEDKAPAVMKPEECLDFLLRRRLGKMLRRVAYLGAEVPQVKGLADIPTPEPMAEAGGKYRTVERFSDRTAGLSYLGRVPLEGAGREGCYACFSEVTGFAEARKVKVKAHYRTVGKARVQEEAEAPPPPERRRPPVATPDTDGQMVNVDRPRRAGHGLRARAGTHASDHETTVDLAPESAVPNVVTVSDRSLKDDSGERYGRQAPPPGQRTNHAERPGPRAPRTQGPLGKAGMPALAAGIDAREANGRLRPGSDAERQQNDEDFGHDGNSIRPAAEDHAEEEDRPYDFAEGDPVSYNGAPATVHSAGDTHAVLGVNGRKVRAALDRLTRVKRGPDKLAEGDGGPKPARFEAGQRVSAITNGLRGRTGTVRGPHPDMEGFLNVELDADPKLHRHHGDDPLPQGYALSPGEMASAEPDFEPPETRASATRRGGHINAHLSRNAEGDDAEFVPGFERNDVVRIHQPGGRMHGRLADYYGPGMDGGHLVTLHPDPSAPEHAQPRGGEHVVWGDPEGAMELVSAAGFAPRGGGEQQLPVGRVPYQTNNYHRQSDQAFRRTERELGYGKQGWKGDTIQDDRGDLTAARAAGDRVVRRATRRSNRIAQAQAVNKNAEDSPTNASPPPWAHLLADTGPQQTRVGGEGAGPGAAPPRPAGSGPILSPSPSRRFVRESPRGVPLYLNPREAMAFDRGPGEGEQNAGWLDADAALHGDEETNALIDAGGRRPTSYDAGGYNHPGSDVPGSSGQRTYAERHPEVGDGCDPPGDEMAEGDPPYRGGGRYETNKQQRNEDAADFNGMRSGTGNPVDDLPQQQQPAYYRQRRDLLDGARTTFWHGPHGDPADGPDPTDQELADSKPCDWQEHTEANEGPGSRVPRAGRASPRFDARDANGRAWDGNGPGLRYRAWEAHPEDVADFGNNGSAIEQTDHTDQSEGSDMPMTACAEGRDSHCKLMAEHGVDDQVMDSMTDEQAAEVAAALMRKMEGGQPGDDDRDEDDPTKKEPPAMPGRPGEGGEGEQDGPFPMPEQGEDSRKYAERARKYAEGRFKKYAEKIKKFGELPEQKAAKEKSEEEDRKKTADVAGLKGAQGGGLMMMSEQRLEGLITACVHKALPAALKGAVGAAVGQIEKFTEDQVRASRKGAIDSILDELHRDGKMAPAERRDVFKTLMLADAVTVHKFSESGRDVSCTAYQHEVNRLRKRPSHFREKVGTAAGAGPDEHLERVTRFSESGQFSGALKASGKSKEQYVQDFKKVQAVRPGATAADYGVPADFA